MNAAILQHSQPQSAIQQVQQQQQQQQQAQQAAAQASQATVQQAQPQVITLQQLQNFLPQQTTTTPQIHQLNASDAAQLQQQVQAFQAQAAAVAGSPQQNASQNQAQQLKTLYASPTGQQQVINLPQQFIQLKNDQMPQQQIIQLKQPDGSVTQQIIQLKPNEQQIPQQQQQPMQQVIQGGQIIQGPNGGIFQVVQPMQTVTVDGQEALFIPNQLQNAQPVQQAFITPTGQIVRGPVMAAPGNFLHNMAQTVQLPNGKKFKSLLDKIFTLIALISFT